MSLTRRRRLTRSSRSASGTSPRMHQQDQSDSQRGGHLPKSGRGLQRQAQRERLTRIRAGRRGRPGRRPEPGTTTKGAEAQPDAGQRQDAPCRSASSAATRGRVRLRANAGSPGSDAKGLDEAGRRQAAGQRQHADGDRHQHRDLRHGDVEAAKQGLKHQPFGDKAVERRQGRDGGRADQEEERRPGHPLDQPAHLFHVARVRGVQHRTRAQEEQALETGVVDRVVQPADEAQRGQRHQPVAVEDQPSADAHQDDADVLHRVIGQQPLEVVLHQRIEHAQQRRDRAQPPARPRPTRPDRRPADPAPTRSRP